MPSTFTRYAPMFLLVLVLWSFIFSFTLGLIVSITVVGVGISVYRMTVKKWEDVLEDELLNIKTSSYDKEA